MIQDDILSSVEQCRRFLDEIVFLGNSWDANHGYRHFESQKSISRNLPEDKLRWISDLIGLCKKLNIIYNIIILIQSLRQTVQSDVQFMNESFFWIGSF